MSQQIPERFSGGAVDLSHLAASHTAAQGHRQAVAGGYPGAASAGPNSEAPASAASEPGAAQGPIVNVPALIFEVSDQTFEQAAQLSGVVPVVFHLHAEESEPSRALRAVLETVTNDLGGRLILARVDAQANPGLAQAFQVQSIPTVVALLGGRPVPLFQGPAPEEQVRDLFGQLLQLAQQQGVNGRVNAPEMAEDDANEPAEPPTNPAHAEALDAIDRGDYTAAVAAYEQVLLKAPADHEARAALVQVRLLERLQGTSLDEIRQNAAANPTDLDAQLRVADLDVSGGHVEDAFLRLLDLFSESVEDAERTQIRERLLELFEVVGQADPRVAAARTRLANLLY